jgi:hypothetical protein
MVLVSVTHPQLESENRQQFTTYLVSVQSTASHNSSNVTENGNPKKSNSTSNTRGGVRRRYSDFQWLYQRLRTELPGAVIPIIPHYRAIADSKRFDPEFVEVRRLDLDRFLKTVVEHAELSRAPSMTPFMLDKLGIEFDKGKKSIEIEHPTLAFDDDHLLSSSLSATKGISSLLARVRVSTGSKEKLMSTGHEKEVNAIKEYLDKVERHVKQLAKSADSMIQVNHDMASAIEGLGAPIAEWKSTFYSSKSSSSSSSNSSTPTTAAAATTTTTATAASTNALVVAEDSILDMMSALVEFSTDFSTLLYAKHVEEHVALGRALQTLALDIRAFQVAWAQRKSWQVTYTATYQQVIDQEAAIAKSCKALKPPAVTAKLQDDKSILEKKSAAEKAKLDESTRRLLQEFQRLQPRFEVALRNAIRDYATVQMSYTTRIHEAWGQLLPFVGVNDEQQQQQQHASDPAATTIATVTDTAIPPMPLTPPPPPPPSS